MSRFIKETRFNSHLVQDLDLLRVLAAVEVGGHGDGGVDVDGAHGAEEAGVGDVVVVIVAALLLLFFLSVGPGALGGQTGAGVAYWNLRLLEVFKEFELISYLFPSVLG